MNTQGQSCTCKIVENSERQLTIQRCAYCLGLAAEVERLRLLGDTEAIKRDWIDLVSSDDDSNSKLEKLRASVLSFVAVVVHQDNDLRAEVERLKAELDQDVAAQQELDKLLEYARKVKGSRDVHSVYEVLDVVQSQSELIAQLVEALGSVKSWLAKTHRIAPNASFDSCAGCKLLDGVRAALAPAQSKEVDYCPRCGRSC